MTKRALFVVAGFLGCCLSVSAQETQRSRADLCTLSSSRGTGAVNTHADFFRRLNGSYDAFSGLVLADGGYVSLANAYNWIEPVLPDFVPIFSTPATTGAAAAGKSWRDSDITVVEAKHKVFDYFRGEAGVLYGTSTGGKFSRELEAGYIFGEMGNDKTQITVGTSYEHSSGRVPYFGH
jgi:hypothetical protein